MGNGTNDPKVWLVDWLEPHRRPDSSAAQQKKDRWSPTLTARQKKGAEEVSLFSPTLPAKPVDYLFMMTKSSRRFWDQASSF